MKNTFLMIIMLSLLSSCNGPVSFYGQNTLAFKENSCTNMADGGTIQRVRYYQDQGEVCLSEVQTSTCTNGISSEFDGTYTYQSCNTTNKSETQLTCVGHEDGEEIERIRYFEDVAYTCLAEIQYSTCLNQEMTDFDGSFTYESCNEIPKPPSSVIIENTGGANVIPWETLTCKATGGSDLEGDVTYEVTWNIGGNEFVGDEEYLITVNDRGKNISCSAISIDETGLRSISTNSTNTLTVDPDICNSNNSNDSYQWSFSELRDGSQSAPLAICTEEQYLSFAKNCGYDNGSLNYQSCPYSYELLRDLDFSSYGSLDESYLVGSADYWGVAMMPYTEVFDGNFHTISNFSVSTSIDTGYFGLFSYAHDAIIKNIILENTSFYRNLAGIGPGGGIVGHCENTYIDSIQMDLILETDFDGGALVGTSKGCYISNIDLVADITLQANTSNAAGNGLIGDMTGDGSITNGIFDINLTLNSSGVSVSFITDELAGNNLTLENLIFKGNFNVPASALGYSNEVYMDDVIHSSVGYVSGEISVSGTSNILDSDMEKANFTDLNTMISSYFDPNIWTQTSQYPSLRIFD